MKHEIGRRDEVARRTGFLWPDCPWAMIFRAIVHVPPAWAA